MKCLIVFYVIACQHLVRAFMLKYAVDRRAVVCLITYLCFVKGKIFPLGEEKKNTDSTQNNQ